MVPRLVTTSVTLPFFVLMASTLVSMNNLAPRDFAPAAKALVNSVGSITPSVGVKAAPKTPSIFMSGNNFCASFGESNSMGIPKERAIPTKRCKSCIRSGDEARRKPPTSRQPVSTPVSSPMRRYRSVL